MMVFYRCVSKIVRSVEINTFQSSPDFVLDIIPSDSSSLADNSNYDFWHVPVGHPCKAIVNLKLNENGD
jgi:hypothetical protein